MRATRRMWMCRGGVAAGLLIGLMCGVSDGPGGNFQITVIDGATGNPTPARVRLLDDAGRVPAPPLGAIALRWGRNDGYDGDTFQPDSAFYVDGRFSMNLPPGTYQLEITKGIEFLAHTETITMTSGDRVNREITLDRWIDMRQEGWFSGDDHIHVRRSRDVNTRLLRWIAAEDIHVGNILRMGDARRTYFEQYAFGKMGRYQEADRVLIPGQEDPRTWEIGHTISLNIVNPIHDSLQYYLYDNVFDSARFQGGLSGYAHQGMIFNAYRGMSLDVPRGKIDFLELHQHCVPGGPLHLRHYYRFLDMGYQLTALAGSDFPWCGTHIGNSRFYTHLPGDFSADAWADNVRAGHTFVTDGPMLLLTVNGALPGETLDVARGTVLHVRVEAIGHETAAPLKNLAVISHSQVRAESERVVQNDKGRQSIEITRSFNVTDGLWIAAACSTVTGQVAHTTPVYVRVDGGPTWNQALLAQHLDETETDLREVEGLIRGKGVPWEPTRFRNWNSRRDQDGWELVDRSENRIFRLAEQLQVRVDASRAALRELAREAGL